MAPLQSSPASTGFTLTNISDEETVFQVLYLQQETAYSVNVVSSVVFCSMAHA